MSTQVAVDLRSLTLRATAETWLFTRLELLFERFLFRRSSRFNAKLHRFFLIAAIKASIRHWKRDVLLPLEKTIRRNQRVGQYPVTGRYNCTLCGFSPSCGACPLNKVGERCGDTESPYHVWFNCVYMENPASPQAALEAAQKVVNALQRCLEMEKGPR